MSARSQNGWKANDRSLISSYRIPGGKVALRKGDVATVLVYVANRFHNEVEALKWPGNWGYAERPIRGGKALSNHASGTAFDSNAPKHPLGKRGTFTKKQVQAIRRILKDCDGVVRWGGDYKSRADEMHFEINKGSTAVRNLARKIRGDEKPAPKTNSRPKAQSKTEWRTVKYGDTLKRGTKGAPVKEWQEKALGYTGKALDGYFGANTERDTKQVQIKNGFRGKDVDGIVGPKTWPLRLKNNKKVAKVKFPLKTGHWFGPESKSPKNHSGYWSSDRPHIKRIQKRLGLTQTGRYNSVTYNAVKKFQRSNKLRVDGGVGSSTWGKMF